MSYIGLGGFGRGDLAYEKAELSKVLNDVKYEIDTGKKAFSNMSPAQLVIGEDLARAKAILDVAMNAGIATSAEMLSTASAAVAEALQVVEKMKGLFVQGQGATPGQMEGLKSMFQSLMDSYSTFVEKNAKFGDMHLLNGSLDKDNTFKSDVNGSSSTSSRTLSVSESSAGVTINGVPLKITVDTAVDATTTAFVDGFIGIKAKTVQAANAALSAVVANPASVSGSTDEIKVALFKASQTISMTFGESGLAVKSVMTGVAGELIVKVGEQVTLGYNADDVVGSLGAANLIAVGQTRDVLVQSEAKAARSEFVAIDSAQLQPDKSVTVAGVTFRLVSGTVVDPKKQIKVDSSSPVRTMQNIVNALNVSNHPALQNFVFEAGASFSENTNKAQIQVTTKAQTGKYNGMAILSIGDTTVSLAGGQSGGLDVSTIVNNPDFVGKMQSMRVVQDGAMFKASLRVGEHLYEGHVNQDAYKIGGSATLIMRSNSFEGGYLTLALNKGAEYGVSAAVLETELNRAFSGVTLLQNRSVYNFKSDDTILRGTTMSASMDDFDKVAVTSVDISKNRDSLSFSVTLSNGKVFEAMPGAFSGKDTIEAGSNIVLSDKNAPESKITFHVAQDLIVRDQESVKHLQQVLSQALRTNVAPVVYQVGQYAHETLEISLGDITLKTLFEGADMDFDAMVIGGRGQKIVEDAIKKLSSYQGLVLSKVKFVDIITKFTKTHAASLEKASKAYLAADVEKSQEEYKRKALSLTDLYRLISNAERDEEDRRRYMN